MVPEEEFGENWAAGAGALDDTEADAANDADGLNTKLLMEREALEADECRGIAVWAG
jgi:hypothetical protein